MIYENTVDPRPNWLIDLEYDAFFSPLITFEDYAEAENAWLGEYTLNPTRSECAEKIDRIKSMGSKWIRKEKRGQLYFRDTFVCQYCCADLRDVSSNLRHLDHITSRMTCCLRDMWDQVNKSTNLVTSCGTCNDIKVDSTLIGFLDSLAAFGYDPRNVRKRIRNAISRKLPPRDNIDPLDVIPLPSLEPVIPYISIEERRLEMDRWLRGSSTLKRAPWRGRNPEQMVSSWDEWLDIMYPEYLFE